MKNIILLISIILSISQIAQSQHKREFRGVWITSVSNLDWPKPEHRGDSELQKADLIQIFDKMVNLNMNAALLQVRPECDALYNSAYEPWSRFLSSPQGTNPGYDPLQFAIDQAHKRGIELHAWLNPYRINASTSDGGDYYHSTHVYREHPEWTISYSDGKKILNPGLPEVTQYIKEVVGDIVQNYDVDGIHFDDYFYAYGGTPDELDQVAFDASGYADRGDFRRGSINNMVSEVFDTIQQIRPYVRFGISPFGIYGNGMNPSGIAGLDAYNVIYCDPLAWLQAGTVDYVNPQLYWPTGGQQDYETLLPWWGQHAFDNNRHLFSGNGTYRLADNPSTKKAAKLKNFFKSIISIFSSNKSTNDPTAAWTLSQLELQIDINRSNRNKNVLGSVFFRYGDFDRVNGLADYTKSNIFITKSLPPVMDWKTTPTLNIPNNLRIEYDATEQSNVLTWDYPNEDTRFEVYIDDVANGEVDITNPDNLFNLTYKNKLQISNSFPVPQAIKVTAIDRDGFESTGSTNYSPAIAAKPSLSLPANLSTVAQGFSFEWQNLTEVTSYVLELATDASFTNIIATENGITKYTFVSLGLQLNGEETYYWRVAGMNPSGQGVWSDPFSFTTGFPGIPVITNPSNMETNVALSPEVSWTGETSAETIYIEIAEGGTSFDVNNIIINQTVSSPSGNATITGELKGSTTHYVRLKSENTYGSSPYSDTVQFKTLMSVPGRPTITSPQNNQGNVSTYPTINWNNVDGATSYIIEIAEEMAFTDLVFTTEVFLTNTYTGLSLIDDKTYYLRVAGKNIGGQGDWSDTIKFYTGVATAVNKLEANRFQLFCYPNPVGNEQLTISYKVDRASDVEIKIIDNTGKVYKVFSESFFQKGDYKIELDVSDLASGIWFIEMQSKEKEVLKFIKE